MKKVLLVAACAALVTGVASAQTVLDLEIEYNSPYLEIYGTLSGDASEGLALVGVDLTADTEEGFNGIQQTADTCAPAGMSSFVKNAGLTNPAGYCGTPSSWSLLQIGGGQNTINYSGSSPDYPTGTVVLDVASTRQLIAQIELDTSAFTGDNTYTLSEAFANVINDGETGPVYAVSPADITMTTPAVVVGAGFVYPECDPPSTAACPNADVDCDNDVDLFDLGVVRNTANWGYTAETADNPRADVDRDGKIDLFDLGVIRNTACWGQ